MGIRLFLVVCIFGVITRFFMSPVCIFQVCIHLQRYGVIVASIYFSISCFY